MYIGATTIENSSEFPQKIKNRTTMWSSNSTFEHLPEENKNTHAKIYTNLQVSWSIIYKAQAMQTT